MWSQFEREGKMVGIEDVQTPSRQGQPGHVAAQAFEPRRSGPTIHVAACREKPRGAKHKGTVRTPVARDNGDFVRRRDGWWSWDLREISPTLLAELLVLLQELNY